MSVQYLSRGTTRSIYWSEERKHGNGAPVLDQQGRQAYFHHLLMPLVTTFLGSNEEDQLCVKGNYWAEVKTDEGLVVEPFDLDTNWASIKAEDVCFLFEAARELEAREIEAASAVGQTLPRRRVTLVWVEDVQPSAQGRVYVATQSFLLELGDSPAATAFGLDLQERHVYAPDYHTTGEYWVHRGEIAITGAALALACTRHLLQYDGEHDRLGTELGEVGRSPNPNTYLADLPTYVQHLGDIPRAPVPDEAPVPSGVRARFAKGATNRGGGYPLGPSGSGTPAEQVPDVFS